MAKRNYFTPSKKSWGFPNWKTTCPPFTFKTVRDNKFPDFVPKKLSEKYNSGYFASSGTTAIYQGESADFYIGFFVGLRRDKNELDEQPYVVVFNQKTGEKAFDGYLQHGDYAGRTTQLTLEQLAIINSSGLTVDIQTNRLPDIDSGHLLYLDEKKIITGLEVSAIKAMEELKNKSYPTQSRQHLDPMTLNNRELIFVTYSTNKNWEKDLPKNNWLCILVDNDRPRQYIDEVISKIIENDVCWVLTVGESCELIHDLVDEEIAFRQVDIDDLYLPKHDIMTTWHTEFDEGIWFGIFGANDEDVQIDKVIILDMSEGKEGQRITKLIEEYNADT